MRPGITHSTVSATCSGLGPASPRRKSRKAPACGVPRPGTRFSSTRLRVVRPARRIESVDLSTPIAARAEDRGDDEPDRALARRRDRWDDEPPGETWEEEELEQGYAPWEVTRLPSSHREPVQSSPKLERGVFGRAPLEVPDRRLQLERETPSGSRALLHREVEPGGELVWGDSCRGTLSQFSAEWAAPVHHGWLTTERGVCCAQRHSTRELGAHPLGLQHERRAAHMQEAIQPTILSGSGGPACRRCIPRRDVGGR